MILSLSSISVALTRRSGMALALPLLIAACGQADAPTKADIQQVIQTRMQAANQQTSNSTLGLFSGPYDVNDFSVTGADCTAKDNGVYACVVTAVTKKGTNTAQLQFKKVNGSWTLVVA
ncbi:hypothetical protein [Lichenicola sp.]|uniref:hypothetical protein n=1 Tax=Lichenicola sp. TaxID=2804529 RepID=UPI003B00C7CB